MKYLKKKEWFEKIDAFTEGEMPGDDDEEKEEDETRSKILFEALFEEIKEEEIKDVEITEEESEKLINDAFRVYDKLKEKSCLDYYFSMIYLLSNVAQVAPLPLKMLRTIATPQHLRLLFELLLVVSPKSKLKLIKIIGNLHSTQLPAEVFSGALKEPIIK